MPVFNHIPQFLYPESRQFPFDEVCENIVRALEKRNWTVPGIEVEFYNYGSGEEKYRNVTEIKGDDFKLFFCRGQGKVGSFSNFSAISEITIPKQELTVFEDESGPTYRLYVGKDWEHDKEWFLDSTKVLAKLDNEPRRYLKYTGEDIYDKDCNRKRAEKLVADNDLNREYSPEGDEPVEINLQSVFEEISNWLKENVLDYILSFAEDVVQIGIQVEEPVWYLGRFKKVYSLCKSRDNARILNGLENRSSLKPAERYAMEPYGSRVVSLNTPNDGRFPEEAYDSGLWCEIETDENGKLSKSLEYERLGYLDNYFNYLLTINIKYSNNVYVFDYAKYEETRQKLFKKIAPRQRLTEEEYQEALVARGATLVPIDEYQGGFKHPIVIIGRELDFDEIEDITVYLRNC